MKNKNGLLFFSSAVSLLLFYFFNRATVLYQSLEGDFMKKTNAAIDGFFSGNNKQDVLYWVRQKQHDSRFNRFLLDVANLFI